MAEIQSFDGKKATYVTAAASIGTLIEYYDFFLSSVAAGLVWPTIFFSFASTALAAALSIATFGIVYLARPFGAFIFGHYGDWLGRKRAVIWTFVVAGIGSLGIALLPPYATLGAISIFLLLLFRVLQGIGIGGDSGAAMTWVSEVTAKAKRRSFWAGWVMVVAPAGILLSSLSFGYISGVLSNAAFIDWGWRVLFGIGAILLFIGAAFRYKLEESLIFKALEKQNALEKKSPAITVIKKEWKLILVLAGASLYMVAPNVILISPYSVNYMVALGTTKSFAAYAISIGSAFGVIMSIIAAYLGDMFKKKNVMFAGAVFSVIFSVPYLALIRTGIPFYMVLAPVLMYLAVTVANGIVPSFFPEQFKAKYRASGSGISFQLGGFITGLIATFILPTLILISGGVLKAGNYVIMLTALVSLVSVISLISLRARKNVDLAK